MNITRCRNNTITIRCSVAEARILRTVVGAVCPAGTPWGAVTEELFGKLRADGGIVTSGEAHHPHTGSIAFTRGAVPARTEEEAVRIDARRGRR